jgi:hypothetical protein
MDLIERYLQAVQFWLPKGQKQDIIAELSEDVHAQIEEREGSLGRPLTEPEIEEILIERGRPVLVANRFLPQQSLIGPVLFPIYLFVVKVVMIGYMVPWALVWIGMMIWNPTYRAHQLSHSLFEAVASAWSAWWGTAFLAVGTVTIVFAILERVQAKQHFLEEWNPRKLPAVRNPNLITRPTASFELLVNAICVVVWASNMYTPVTMISEVRFSVSPLWHWFFWGFLVVSIVNTALAAVNIARPYWTTQRAIIRLLSDAAGSALFCWLLKANVLTGFATSNMTPEQSATVTNMINFWIAKSFPICLAVCIAVAGANLYRIIRLNAARLNPRFEPLPH